MKIIAYTALRYGKDYYDAAIRSIIDAVDEYHVLYAVNPSHGHWSDVPCPETEDELRAIAEHRAGSKLRWHRGHWAYEGQQRESIHQYAPDADVILVLDADEVWGDGLAQDAVDFALRSEYREIRMPFIHLWRSFRRGFAHDPAYPVRVVNPNRPKSETTMPTDKRIWHFGYAQREEIIAYKIKIHGHLGEFRRDINWLEDVFLANRQHDCHIVGSEYWYCEDIDLSKIPTVLLDHPYYNLEVIR